MPKCCGMFFVQFFLMLQAFGKRWYRMYYCGSHRHILKKCKIPYYVIEPRDYSLNLYYSLSKRGYTTPEL